MTLRIGLAVILMVCGATCVWAQAPENWRASPPAVPSQPDQPVVPNDPALQTRPPQAYGPQPYPSTPAVAQAEAGPMPAGGPAPVAGAQVPPGAAPNAPGAARASYPPPEFVLGPQQEAELNAALKDWEEKSKNVQNFACTFTRLNYDFGLAAMQKAMDPNKRAAPVDPREPTSQVKGEMKFSAPDKGLFKINAQAPEKPELWICDGRSIFSYDYDNKIVQEYPLPAQLQGKAIADGPLPFIFGASAAKLKQRYYLRIMAGSPGAQPGDTWLEALPKYQQDAANFSSAKLILSSDKLPVALDLYMPNGKDHTVYLFQKPTVNALFAILQNNTFQPWLGLGWKKVVQNPDEQRVGSQQPRPQR